MCIRDSASSAEAAPRIPPTGPPWHDWRRRTRVPTATGPRPGPFSTRWSRMMRSWTRGGPCAR
eukprot:10789545-Alexandrium_andersonii.AAC.1